jgi:hypothetical protein
MNETLQTSLKHIDAVHDARQAIYSLPWVWVCLLCLFTFTAWAFLPAVLCSVLPVVLILKGVFRAHGRDRARFILPLLGSLPGLIAMTLVMQLILSD